MGFIRKTPKNTLFYQTNLLLGKRDLPKPGIVVLLYWYGDDIDFLSIKSIQEKFFLIERRIKPSILLKNTLQGITNLF